MKLLKLGFIGHPRHRLTEPPGNRPEPNGEHFQHVLPQTDHAAFLTAFLTAFLAEFLGEGHGGMAEFGGVD